MFSRLARLSLSEKMNRLSEKLSLFIWKGEPGLSAKVSQVCLEG